MKTILFYGDSNTYGYDPRGFGGGRYPASVRWTDRLKETLGAEWRILADAMNGREIPGYESAVRRVLDLIRTAGEGKEDLLFAVMLGTNDLFSAFGHSAAMYTAAKMNAFLGKIREAFPDLGILLVAPPAIGSSESSDDEIRSLYHESRQLSLLYHTLAAQRGFAFASAFQWDVPLAYDEVHLSEEGHRVFAEEMEKVLREVCA